MKNKLLVIALILMCILLILVGCTEDNEGEGGNNNPPPSIVPDPTVPDSKPDPKPEEAVVTVRGPYDVQMLLLLDEDVANTDFTKYFSIKTSSSVIPVLEEYLDKTNFSATQGGTIVCTYQGKQATLNVQITSNVYHLSLTTNQVTVYVDQTNEFDYLALFKATKNGEVVSISADMVTSNVQSKAGDYTFVVDFYGNVKTLHVTVLDRVEITSSTKRVELKDEEVAKYNFKQLFTIVVNGKTVPVLDKYLDLSDLPTSGYGTIVCSYGVVSCEVTVSIKATVYVVDCQKDSLRLHVSAVDGYDFLSLFSATKDGKKVELTSDNVTSNVQSVAGEYTYTVTVGTASKTLHVVVSNDHLIEIVCNYPNLQLAYSNLTTFDYTWLFSLYVDEKAVEVTSDMLDLSQLENASVGDVVTVGISVTHDGTSASATTNVQVVETPQIAIQAINVETYPNSAPLDLTTLFTITNGIEVVEVLPSMISGVVDYTTAGENVITLNYLGQTATAVVTVKMGVVITTVAPQVDVKIGTNLDRYFFENDFNVIVNGERVENIFPYLDLTGVDFNTEGSYPVTIKVPYSNSKPSGLGGTNVPFVYYEQTIVYNVVKNTYSVDVVSQDVEINKSNVQYNPLSNVKVEINGISQTLTQNPNHVDVISCYVRLLTPIDYNNIAKQLMQVEVYVNGPQNDAVLVEFFLTVKTSVAIETTDMVVFTGATVYAKDLFTLTDNGQVLEVTNDMLYGHVDTFNAGVYTVQINYMGLTKQATVTVIDSGILGRYVTNMTTFATDQDIDEDGDVIQDAVQSRRYGALNLSMDSFVVDGQKAQILSALDENTFVVKFNGNKYVMHVQNGIIVLDPDNSLNMEFTNEKRPLVYFKSDTWTLKGRLVISNHSTHVLENLYTGYTIEVFEVQSLADSSTYTFALNVRLISHMNSNTYYKVNWGQAIFNDGFVAQEGEQGMLTLGDKLYSFQMTDNVMARITTTETDETYNGKSFSGTVDGQKATLRFTAMGGASFSIGTSKMFDMSPLDVAALKNGGVNSAKKEVLLYSMGETSQKKYFSYKFIIDEENSTFTLVEKDSLWGFYEYGNTYIFLDGYGSGVVSYDRSSYHVTYLTYQKVGNEVHLSFQNDIPDLVNGDSATLYVADTLNVLTAKTFQNAALVGQKFVNRNIVDGAIITVAANFVHKGQTAKDDLINAITIQTKDGILSYDEKKACIDATCISQNVAGTYQYKITLNVSGKTYVSYHVVQVLVPLSTTSPFMQNYGQSVISTSYKLVLDSYGIATVTCGENVFVGNVIYKQDGFVVKAKCNGMQIVMEGVSIADGIVGVSCSGAVNFYDYFTTGTTSVVGTNGCVLRQFTVNGQNHYVLCETATSRGELATIVSLNGKDVSQTGAIVQITTATKQVVVKVNGWKDVIEGLSVSDNARGTYTKDDQTLEIDGFGTAKLNGVSASYTLNYDGSVYVGGSVVAVFDLDKQNQTFARRDMDLGNALVQGKTFASEYYYVCNDYSFIANTQFVFQANGQVLVVSTSSEHDEGDIACGLDTYNPSFASKTGVVGHYSTNGNKVTVQVNGTTFVFEIADIVLSNTLTCTSTTLADDAHGHFSVGTIFKS